MSRRDVQQRESPVSPMALSLTGPIATLIVGGARSATGSHRNSPVTPTNTQPLILNAHVSLLCKMPFFKIALQGNFKEATMKVIEMPEDEPAVVVSLLEFLYKGNYQTPQSAQASGAATTSNPLIGATTSGKSATAAPSGVAKGSRRNNLSIESYFLIKWHHAQVVILAEKYCYADLVSCALKKLQVLSRIMPASVSEMETRQLYLEYLVMIYQTSGDSSVLRLPKYIESEPTVAITTGDPQHTVVKWDYQGALVWLVDMWKDPQEAQKLNAALGSCADLGRDLLNLVAMGWAQERQNSGLSRFKGDISCQLHEEGSSKRYHWKQIPNPFYSRQLFP